MCAILKAWLLKLVLQRSFGAVIAALLLILTPVAAMLKVVGLPILFVLLLIGAPLLILLVIIGLPIILVVGATAAIVGIISAVLVAGLALLKIALPILLVAWLVRWMMSGRNGNDGDEPKSETSESS